MAKKGTIGKKKPAKRKTSPMPIPEKLTNVDDDADESDEPEVTEDSFDLDLPEPIASARLVALEFIDRESFQIDDRKFNSLFKKLTSMVEELETPGGTQTYDSWAEMDSTPISKATESGNIFEPIKIVGTLSRIGADEPYNIDAKTVKANTLTIADRYQNTLETFPVPEGVIPRNISSSDHISRTYTILGGCVPVRNAQSGKGKYLFFVYDIRRDVSAWDLIIERPVGKDAPGFRMRIGQDTYGIKEDHPYMAVSQYGKKTNGILEHIRSELVSTLGIKGSDTAKELHLCIEFTILQAFSQGVGKYSEKLHSLVIGPPNSGKSFLTKIALMLNPVSQEVPSNSGKVTEAGLVGTVKQGSRKNISSPGILPNNSGGVVCIQDFHSLTGGARNAVFGIFSLLMEDGKVIDATSGNTVHPAATSLHLDENRLSDIYPGRKFNSYEDIAIPTNILSRFDFIAEIPRDSERQDAVSAAMTNVDKMGEDNASWEENSPGRRLKMLVAWLRSQNRSVRFTDEINGYIRKNIASSLLPLKSDPKYDNNLQAVQLRLTNSVYKLVKAIACANDTSVAREEFVDYAMKFVDSKVKFIASIEPEDESAIKPGADDQQARQGLIRGKFLGKKNFTISEVADYVRSSMDGTISEKTLKRDLKQLGAKTGKGTNAKWNF